MVGAGVPRHWHFADHVPALHPLRRRIAFVSSPRNAGSARKHHREGPATAKARIAAHRLVLLPFEL